MKVKTIEGKIITPKNPIEKDVNYTKDYVDSKKKYLVQLKKQPSKDNKVVDEKQGIIVNKETGDSAPIPMKRKIIVTGKGMGSSTTILSTDGKKVIFKGRTTDRSTKDAIDKSNKDEKYGNKAREENANFMKINTGNKKDLDSKDLSILKDLSKVK